jgi:transposase
MAISLPDARQLSDEVLEALRLRALRGRERGLSEAALADLLGVSPETICRWWTAYVAGGLDALPGDRSGRLLPDDQGRRVRRLLDEHTPEDLGVAAPLWSRRAVRALIERECGVRLAVRTVGEYLKRWGYTAKKPRRHARRQDPEEVRQWLEETYPALEQRAGREGAAIFWCDETGVAADEQPARGYAKEGTPVAQEVPEPHLRMNQISAISNRGQVRFLTYAGTMTAVLFLKFLGRLLRGTTGKVFLIVDRLRAHQTPAVADWVAAHAARLELCYLPRRAPELNADEYLNHDLKANVHAEGLPDSRPELRSHIQAFMRRLIHLPRHVMNYFQHPCVQYAAGM